MTLINQNLMHLKLSCIPDATTEWVLLELVLSSAVLPDYLRTEELKWLTVQVPPAGLSH